MRTYLDNLTIVAAIGLCMVFSGLAQADLRSGYFTDVKPVPGLDSPYHEECPSISADGLTIYFTSDRPHTPGGYKYADIWVATRETISEPFGEAVKLGPDHKSILERAMRNLGMTARGYNRVLKVARTIADLEGARFPSPENLAEALQYRPVLENQLKRF